MNLTFLPLDDCLWGLLIHLSFFIYHIIHFLPFPYLSSSYLLFSFFPLALSQSFSLSLSTCLTLSFFYISHTSFTSLIRVIIIIGFFSSFFYSLNFLTRKNRLIMFVMSKGIIYTYVPPHIHIFICFSSVHDIPFFLLLFFIHLRLRRRRLWWCNG